jgi:Tfp pilus assembly major pilin PilA
MLAQGVIFFLALPQNSKNQKKIFNFLHCTVFLSKNHHFMPLFPPKICLCLVTTLLAASRGHDCADFEAPKVLAWAQKGPKKFKKVTKNMPWHGFLQWECTQGGSQYVPSDNPVGRPPNERKAPRNLKKRANHMEMWRESMPERRKTAEKATGCARKACTEDCRHKIRLKNLRNQESLLKDGRRFMRPTRAGQWVAVAICGPKENRDYVTARVKFIHSTTAVPTWAVFETRKKDGLSASQWAAPIEHCFCIAH